MTSEEIKEFCHLVIRINEVNCELDKDREDFYYGGHSFEQVFSHRFEFLKQLEDRLYELLNNK